MTYYPSGRNIAICCKFARIPSDSFLSVHSLVARTARKRLNKDHDENENSSDSVRSDLLISNSAELAESRSGRLVSGTQGPVGPTAKQHGNSATPAATYTDSMAKAGDGTTGVSMVRRVRPTTIARPATIRPTTSTRTPIKAKTPDPMRWPDSRASAEVSVKRGTVIRSGARVCVSRASTADTAIIGSAGGQMMKRKR